jgi:hypothetical protein
LGILLEVEPGRFRFVKPSIAPARSKLPCPNIISDAIAPLEHVDGRFYTSKSQFRAVTKAHGLIEVGTEPLKPKRRSTDTKEVKAQRRTALRTALARFKAGDRPRTSI